jgi:predicted nucleic acid-binding protein
VGYWQLLRELVADGRAAGPRVHDARVAAVCLANGVTELWTADRDFGRFPELRVRNPLVAS